MQGVQYTFDRRNNDKTIAESRSTTTTIGHNRRGRGWWTMIELNKGVVIVLLDGLCLRVTILRIESSWVEFLNNILLTIWETHETNQLSLIDTDIIPF